jgi:hypothetical protein
MPCPHQERLVFANESLNPPQFRARKATASLQARWIQPELGLGFSPLHVNMGRFVSIRRVEEEPVWPGPKNCRQRFQCTCYRKANAANCVGAVGYPGVLHAAFISMIRGVKG